MLQKNLKKAKNTQRHPPPPPPKKKKKKKHNQQAAQFKNKHNSLGSFSEF
jgi:hypothetical protein